MKKRISLISIIIMLLCLSLSVSAATNTTKTAITTITEKAEGKVYIAWSKKSVDGYQVRWALNDRMTGAKTASITKNNATRSGLIGGRTYYFQVRTYKSDGEKKVYSGWSAMKSIKLKKLPPATIITSLTADSSSGFTVRWTKKTGAKGYQIRYSPDSSFKTKKTASTTGSSMKRTNLAKGTYYVSVRSYNVAADGTKYYSNWSGMKKVTLQEDLQKIFKSAAGNYNVLKWGGNWSDEFTVRSDGSFTGIYYDYPDWNKNGQWEGIRYEVEIPYIKYSGKFKVIRQVNQYSYELSLQNYQDLSKNEKPYVKYTSLYRPKKGYILHNEKHIYLYIPSTPTDMLPSAARPFKTRCYLLALDEHYYSGPEK